MQCWQCGKDLAENSAFCISCGAPRARPTIPAEAEVGEEKVHALLAEANLFRLRKNWTGAVARCTEALKLAPNSASAHSLLGDICRDEGRFQDAIEWYKLALGLDGTRKKDRDKLDALIDKVYGASQPPVRSKEGKMSRATDSKAATPATAKFSKLQYSNIFVLVGIFFLVALLFGGLLYLLVYRPRTANVHFNPRDVILTHPSPSSPEPSAISTAENGKPPQAKYEESLPKLPGDNQNKISGPQPTPALELSEDLYLREKKLAETLKGMFSQAGGSGSLLGVELDPRTRSLEIEFSLPASDNAESARAALLETAYYLARAAALEEPAASVITLRGAMKFPAGEGVDDIPAFIGDADGAQLRKTPEGAITSQEAENFFSNIWWLEMLQTPSP